MMEFSLSELESIKVLCMEDKKRIRIGKEFSGYKEVVEEYGSIIKKCTGKTDEILGFVGAMDVIFKARTPTG